MALIKAVAEDAVVKNSTLGKRSTIDHDSVVLNSTIGDYVDIEKRNLIRSAVIGDMTYTGADVGIMWAEVGKFCCIARRVEIGGNEHNYRAASMMPSYRLLNKLGGRLSMHQDEEIIRVGNDVWIGVGATITRKNGLVIGDGAVIGSGAVVTKSVPPYAIVAGVPAKVMRYRFDERVIEKLLRLKWWDWEREKILENWPLLSSDLTEEAVDALLAAQ
jgi:acetyltransferase-like isoleucine patch superfamily enzyme